MDVLGSVEINGSKQWYSARGVSPDLPILLCLHGGPGTAQIPFARKLFSGLEQDFLVINWDQRGSGRSYTREIAKSRLTVSLLVDDTVAMIEYLLKTFTKESLYLLGHSWGSILGFKVMTRIPQLIRAYVGIGQVIDMAKGERLSYEYTIQEASRRSNRKAIQDLQRIGPPPYQAVQDGGVQRDWLGKFQGITYDNSGIAKIFKYYSLKDCGPLRLVQFIQGIVFSLSQLEKEQMEISFEELKWTFRTPCYLICGRYDQNVPSTLAEEWAARQDQDIVKLIWFEKSGHLANFEEQELFTRKMKEIREEVKSRTT